MSTKIRVLEILTGYEASLISFSFSADGTQINIARHIFERVARAIRRGNIPVNVSHVLPAGSGALYIPSTSAIETPPLIKRVDEGHVLRECTRAYFDVATNISVGGVLDLAAAHVVDAMYDRVTAFSRNVKSGTPQAAAGAVADLLLQENRRGKLGIPAVDKKEWANLVALLRRNAFFPVRGRVATAPTTTATAMSAAM